MSIDPTTLGFAWPVETVLTNHSGQQMTVRPFAVNFAGVREAAGQRREERYRYYTSTYGDLTELEVRLWLAGGEAECARLHSAIRQMFVESTSPLSLASFASTLEGQGFSDSTIEINLRWLILDGYISISSDDLGWNLENLRL